MLVPFEDARRKQVFINPHCVAGIEPDEMGTQTIVSTVGGRVYTVNLLVRQVAERLMESVGSGLRGAMVEGAKAAVEAIDSSRLLPTSERDSD
jgi:hypothetical protein